MELTRKLLTVEKLQPVQGEDRTFWAVASTEGKDRSGDIMHSDGWVMDGFLKNPVIPWGHIYSQPPVAQALAVKVENGKLMVKIKFATADEYPFADTIYKLYKGGFLRAFSVGFNPVEAKSLPDGGTEYFQQELYEVSCVTLPDNPEALAEIKSAVKVLEKGGPGDPEPELDPAALAKMVTAALDARIAAAVEKKIKYHLGVVD